MSMTIHVTLLRACAAPCAKQFIATSSVEFHSADERISKSEQRMLEKIRVAFERCERHLAESFGHHQRKCPAGEASLGSGGPSGVLTRENESPVQNDRLTAATQRQIQALYGMTVRHRINLRRLLHDRFRKRHLYELTRNEAGCLIGELQKIQCPQPVESSRVRDPDMHG